MITLSSEQLDTLNELINIGSGQAANTLYELTGMHVTMSVPYVTIANSKQLREFAEGFGSRPVATVMQRFDGAYGGRACLVIPEVSALELISAITDEPLLTEDLDAVQGETLSEVGNIVINAMIGTLNNLLGSNQMNFDLVEYYKDEAGSALGSLYVEESITLIAHIHFAIKDREVSGHVLLAFDIGAADTLFALIDKALQ